MSKDEIRETVGGSERLWRHRRSGRLVRVVGLVGMDYEYLRLKGIGGNRGSKKLTATFFREYDRLDEPRNPSPRRYCPSCEASITSTDEQAGYCTNCQKELTR